MNPFRFTLSMVEYVLAKKEIGRNHYRLSNTNVFNCKHCCFRILEMLKNIIPKAYLEPS